MSLLKRMTCNDEGGSQPRQRDVTDSLLLAAARQGQGPVPQPVFQGVSFIEDCFGVPRFVTATRTGI